MALEQARRQAGQRRQAIAEPNQAIEDAAALVLVDAASTIP